MRILIVEDDPAGREVMRAMVSGFATADLAGNGVAGIQAFARAIEENRPYDLVCIDILMPDKDGRRMLKDLRAIEEKKGIMLGDGAKVIMTTCLSDSKNILGSFGDQCDGYLVKPIRKHALLSLMARLGLACSPGGT